MDAAMHWRCAPCTLMSQSQSVQMMLHTTGAHAELSGARLLKQDCALDTQQQRSLVKQHALPALWNCLLTLIMDKSKAPLPNTDI